MGAGSGLLAKDILDFYEKELPDLYEKINYTIIEKSNYLISRQKEILKNHLKNNKVNWTDFNAFRDFNGIFFSNELVDAFPVHRIINIGGEYKELFVIEHNGRFEFYPDTFSTEKLQEYINNMKIRLTDKQIADINLHATDWIEELGEKINKGLVFTIDYGFDAKQLFSNFRMDGTVTCYFKHTQNNDFFERIGFQDITAFVDFSALEFYGKKSKLDTVCFIPQWLFLIQSGILQEMEEAQTDLQRTSIKSLIIPEGGFGTNFHVLIQSKNIAIHEDFIYKKSSFDTFDMLSRMF
jgi:SAM-dependent MidA family methyltransferase